MEFPQIGNVSKDALMLLGFWLYTVIQFGKGKAWGEKWTIYLSIGLPLLVAAVPIYGDERLNQYAQVVAQLFLAAIGVWAINKASQEK